MHKEQIALTHCWIQIGPRKTTRLVEGAEGNITACDIRPALCPPSFLFGIERGIEPYPASQLVLRHTTALSLHSRQQPAVQGACPSWVRDGHGQMARRYPGSSDGATASPPLSATSVFLLFWWEGNGPLEWESVAFGLPSGQEDLRGSSSGRQSLRHVTLLGGLLQGC